MKHYLIIFLFFSFLTACNSSKQKPKGLMVEFIRDTDHVYILDSAPEFSWIVPGNFKYQSAYQILVARSKEELEDEYANVWNSEKISDNNSVELEYKGLKLADTTTYYWKVRVWGHEMQKPSPFSDIRSFRTGKKKKTLTP